MIPFIAQDYRYKNSITYDSSIFDSAMDEVELFIDESVVDSDIFAEAMANGGDIRLAENEDGTNPLPLNMWDYDNSGQTIKISTKYRDPSTSSDTTIWIFWGRMEDSQPPASYPIGRNLVFSDHVLLALDMDETSGTNCDDKSFHNRDGTYGGGLPTSVASKVGPGQDFDGTNDTLQVTQSGEFDTGAWTWTIWVRPQWTASTKGYAPCIFSLRNGATTRFSVHFTDDYSRIITWNGTGNVAYFPTLSQGNDYHVCVIYDGTGVRIVVNGVDTGASSAFPPAANFNLPFNVGWNGAAEYWDGHMSHVRFYNKTLSVDECQALYRMESDPGTYMSSTAKKTHGIGFPDAWFGYFECPIQASVIDSDLTDFPSMIDQRLLSTSQNDLLFANAASTGFDLVVTDSGGTPIPYVLDYFDPVNKRFRVHYKPTTTSSSSDTTVRLYFGSSQSTYPYNINADAGPNAVWDNSIHEAVWFGTLGVREKGNYDGSKLVLDGLVAHWDAEQLVYNDAGSTLATDGQSVQEWHDLITGKVLNQATGANKPTFNTAQVNGYRSIRFDGVDDYMRYTAASLQAGTIYFVIIPRSGVGYDSLDTIISTDSDTIDIRRHNTDNAFRGNNNTNSADFLDPNGRMVIDGIIFDSYDTGESIVVEARADSVKTYASNFTLGRASAGLARYWKGDIAEILIYDYVVPGGVSSLTRSYLYQKYNRPWIENAGASGNVAARIAPKFLTTSTQDEGQAVDFDPANDDYMFHNVDNINNFINDFAFFSWFELDVVTGIQRLYAQQGLNGFSIGVTGTSLRFTTKTVKDYDIAGSLSAGVWNAVLYSMDSSNDVTFYKDGSDLGTVTHGAPGTVGTTNMNFGRNNGTPSEELDGRIGHSVVYNTAVSDAWGKAKTKNWKDISNYYGTVKFVTLTQNVNLEGNFNLLMGGGFQ